MGTVARSTVTSKGQVTVPQAVRARMGVEAGDRLVWSLRDDGVVEVRKVQARRLDELVGMLGRPGRSATVEEMEQAIRDRFRQADEA